MAKSTIDPSTAEGSAAREHPHRYTAQLADDIETRWQAEWEQRGTFVTPNPGDDGFDPSRPKFFCMDMFPYPSGAGLHVGHAEGYTATDIICRYKRLTGHNVLHPMGWDAFGLPAEQYAIQTGVHPAITTREAIDAFRRQLKRFGFSYDWTREFATIDEDYYRWTQWIWLQAYHCWYDHDEQRARSINDLLRMLRNGELLVTEEHEIIRPGEARRLRVAVLNWDQLSASERARVIDGHRLAYLAEQMVNWCPRLGTALANEEVIDGKSERGGFPVHRMPLRQWMFRITAYAERLLNDLDLVKWPDSTRAMQEAWIGRSEGAVVDFPLTAAAPGGMTSIRVYTTRPDTIFGATFMVLAPEHPLVDAVLSGGPTNVPLGEYVRAARDRSEVDRMATAREKTGVDTGIRAINPATGDAIPVWVADYVLMGYGHGAIMAVPAHDERDFEFARQFDLPIRDVVHTPVLRAVHAFAMRHDPDAIDDPRASLAMLIDFVGLAVNQQRSDYDAIYETIGDRRSLPAEIEEDILTVDEAPVGDTIEAGIPREADELRGTIVSIWREGLRDLVADDLAGLIRDARAGRLMVRLGTPAAEPGYGVNSSNDEVSLDGLPTAQASDEIVAWLESCGRGRRHVNYKLRDWLFSRQRYWGEPFPVVFDRRGEHFAVAETKLPVTLPPLEDFKPIESDEPVPLLAKAESWMTTTAGEAGIVDLPEDVPMTREVNTMPGWAGSCWYYLRFCDPKNEQRFVSREAEQYWMVSRRDGSPCDTGETYDPQRHHAGGVDLYIGGAEHAVLHLLYARFWHKLLFDLKQVSTPEPFGKLFHQGMITSHAFQRADRSLVPVDEVEQRGDQYIETATEEPVTQIIAKMSKTLKNVVNPEDVISEYGADTFRLFEMYLGPLDASKPWNPRDIAGLFRFLQRAWRLAVDETSGDLHFVEQVDLDVERLLHRTIDKVAGDIERLAFNTAIAAMIELVNEATSAGGFTRDQLERFTIVLSPFAPHMAEELWSRLGHETLVAGAEWPAVDPSMLVDDRIELPVQIKGKVRGHITVPADATAEAIEAMAVADSRIAELLAGQSIRKVIVVPGKIVNIIPG